MAEELQPKKRKKRDGSTPLPAKKTRKARAEAGEEEPPESADPGTPAASSLEARPEPSAWGSWIEAEQRWMGAGREVFVTPLPESADEQWLCGELEQAVADKTGSPLPERVKVVHKASGIVCAFVLLLTPEEAQDFITCWHGKPLGSVSALSVSLSKGNLGTADGGEKKKKPVCMFFLEGKCNKGDSCSFAHEGEPGSSAGRRLETCKFFAEGRCSRGAQCKFSHRGVAGATVAAAPSEPALKHDPSIVLQQLYEDDDVLAVSKPAGLACHPSSGSSAGTLAHALVGRVPKEMLQQRAVQRETDSFVPRAIVHRLDLGTSGAIVIAKTPEAEQKLGAALRGARSGEVPANQSVRKTYVAVLLGPAPGAVGSDVPVDVAIARNPDNPKLMAVTEGGQSAHTVIHVHCHNAALQATLVTVDLHTGRMHQIRVHCAHLGAPVAGDVAYGGGGRAYSDLMQEWKKKKKQRKERKKSQEKDGERPAIRPLLHSWALELPHPCGDDQRLKLRAPLPSDIVQVLRRLWPELSLDPNTWAQGSMTGGTTPAPGHFKAPKGGKARKRPGTDGGAKAQEQPPRAGGGAKKARKKLGADGAAKAPAREPRARAGGGAKKARKQPPADGAAEAPVPSADGAAEAPAREPRARAGSGAKKARKQPPADGADGAAEAPERKRRARRREGGG